MRPTAIELRAGSRILIAQRPGDLEALFWGPEAPAAPSGARRITAEELEELSRSAAAHAASLREKRAAVKGASP